MVFEVGRRITVALALSISVNKESVGGSATIIEVGANNTRLQLYMMVVF